MKDTTFRNGSSFNKGTGDPIINLFLVNTPNGTALKIVRLSGACGYVSTNGITGRIENATNLNAFEDLELGTYAEMMAYNFKEGVPITIHVLTDENKNQDNTTYKWTGSVLKWGAEVVNDDQPVAT